VAREVTYGGFVLEREREPLRGRFPAELAEGARRALARALVAGETAHPDQGPLGRALRRLDHYWRRSGGRLAEAAPERLAERVAAQLARVGSWEELLEARVQLDADGLIPAATRARLANTLRLPAPRWRRLISMPGIGARRRKASARRRPAQFCWPRRARPEGKAGAARRWKPAG